MPEPLGMKSITVSKVTLRKLKPLETCLRQLHTHDDELAEEPLSAEQKAALRESFNRLAAESSDSLYELFRAAFN